jgi:hypothetical protein
MKHVKFGFISCALVFVFVFASALVRVASADEKVIKIEDTPKPVLDKVEKLAPGSKVVRSEEQRGDDAKDGKLTYEMDAEKDGKTFQFILGPDGKVYERRQKKLKLADVPEPVRKVVSEQTNGAEPDAMVKYMPLEGKPYYKFRATKESKVVTLTPTGEIIPPAPKKP